MKCWAFPFLFVVATVCTTGPISAAYADEFEEGEELVTVGKTPLKDGSETRLELEAGAKVVAVQVEGSWVAVEVERDGETVTGWIHQKQLKPASAETVATVIPESEIVPKRLAALFRRALLSVEVDKDDDVRIEEQGMKTFVCVDEKRKRLVYFAVWRFKEGVTAKQKLELVNRWNEDLILVRFCMRQEDVLWCDYAIPYEGGICELQVVAAYRLFFKVVVGAITTQDPDDIIGG